MLLMRARLSLPPLLVVAPLMLGGCVGLEAGASYPNYSSGEVGKKLLSPENRPDPSISLGSFKIASKACEGIDTHPIAGKLTQDDFTRFLEAQKIPQPPVKARGNLFWYDFPGGNPEDAVRLRLAVLDDAEGAAADLHAALLDHGPGWWGVRRANLAILAPKAGVAEAVAFALKYKLPCWGVMQMTHVDDVYVIPGPYSEL
jgi:hypothetical protein